MAWWANSLQTQLVIHLSLSFFRRRWQQWQCQSQRRNSLAALCLSLAPSTSARPPGSHLTAAPACLSCPTPERQQPTRICSIPLHLHFGTCQVSVFCLSQPWEATVLVGRRSERGMCARWFSLKGYISLSLHVHIHFLSCRKSRRCPDN